MQILIYPLKRVCKYCLLCLFLVITDNKKIMTIKKNFSSLPPEVYSYELFTYINFNLINQKIERLNNELTAPQIRQLLALQMLSKQRRSLYIGVCSWFKLSPSGGRVYTIRKSNFEANKDRLQALNYIEIMEVPRGKVAVLTLKGELLTNQINTFLTDYYKRIFAQFNLIPVI